MARVVAMILIGFEYVLKYSCWKFGPLCGPCPDTGTFRSQGLVLNLVFRRVIQFLWFQLLSGEKVSREALCFLLHLLCLDGFPLSDPPKAKQILLFRLWTFSFHNCHPQRPLFFVNNTCSLRYFVVAAVVDRNGIATHVSQ